MSRSRRVFRLGLFSFRRMCAKPVRQMCAKPAENRPSDSSRGNGKDPARSVRGPAAGLSVSPFGPSVTVLLAPLLPVCLPACLAFCPSARLPLGRLASATPRLPLGVRLCPPARLPLAPSPRTAAPACRSPQAKGGPLPTERPAPRRSIFPYALGPAVKLAPQRVGGGICDICHQPPRIPRINVARQLRNG